MSGTQSNKQHHLHLHHPTSLDTLHIMWSVLSLKLRTLSNVDEITLWLVVKRNLMEPEEDVPHATFLCIVHKSSEYWDRLYLGHALLLDRLFYYRLEWYLGVSESRSLEEGALLCVVSASHVIPRGAWITLDARTPHNAKTLANWVAKHFIYFCCGNS